VLAVLIWFAAVFVPLCVAGQKQPHYLMPALPPLAILTGWFLDRAIARLQGESSVRTARPPPWADRAMPAVMTVTALIILLGGGALPVAGRVIRGGFLPVDLLAGGLTALAGSLSAWLLLRRKVLAATATFALTAMPLVALVQLAWVPTLDAATYRDVATVLRSPRLLVSGDDGGGAELATDREFAFYAEPANLPLCWAMRQVVSSNQSATDVIQRDFALRNVVLITASASSSPSPPPGYFERYRAEVDKRPVVIYVPLHQAPAGELPGPEDGRSTRPPVRGGTLYATALVKPAALSPG
jgi:hypothetical protein